MSNSGDNTMGEITSPSARAAIRVRWTLEAQRDLDRLTFERRALSTGNAIDIDRLMRQIADADHAFDLGNTSLPRGYRLIRDERRKRGFYLRYNGRAVDDQQFALDIATGWIEELNAMLDRMLAPLRPKAIEARIVTETTEAREQR